MHMPVFDFVVGFFIVPILAIYCIYGLYKEIKRKD
jgi:hypothetical protein